MIESFSRKNFSSKVLLFGEYSVLLSSMALAVPYSLFEGRLVFPSGETNISTDFFHISRQELKSFGEYIRDLSENKELNFTFDYTSFSFDIEQGLYFSSTIPQGCGLGSSGAITAAVFFSYGQVKSGKDDIFQMKKIFSEIESYFHGKSSGLDPLVSYLNSPILIKSKDSLGEVILPSTGRGPGGIFLLNTGTPRKTGPLMNLFLEKLKNQSFYEQCMKTLIPVTNQCILSFLEGDMKSLYKQYGELSSFQYEYLRSMIPNHFRNIWKKGIESEDYYLKLCGAGGGGFLLGMTLDIEKTKKILQEKNTRLLYSY